MWELVKDFLLVSMGMSIGVVLMCILTVGKEADYELKQLEESEDN
ncbi:TPA: DUF3789 domain-containing protein [Clostridioides difficile]